MIPRRFQAAIGVAVVSVFVSWKGLPAHAEEISLGNGASALIEGRVQSLGENRWLLSQGTAVKVRGVAGFSSQQLVSYGSRAVVELGGSGIEYASGVFGLKTELPDGTVVSIPGSLTQLKMKRNPEEEDSLQFCSKQKDLPDAFRCVTWFENRFRVRGTTSAEARRPADGGRPEMLASIAGETDKVVVSSDLETEALFEGSQADRWRVAYSELEKKRKFLRQIKVDENRVGAAAYKAMVRETLEGLTKLKKGYDMLRSGQYTQEVLKRMLQKGVGVPRLELVSCRVVYGDAAFSLNAFENWQGKGRVIANVAFLTNENHDPPENPPFSFTLRDGSGLIREDTRVRLEEGDAVVEIRKGEGSDWVERKRIQFDLLAEVGFSAEEDRAEVQLDLDVTGFLLRKAYKVVGEISLGRIELTRDSITIEYKPVAPSRVVATRFSRFLALRKILTFPRRDVILDDYRPEMVDDRTWEEFNHALDQMAEAVHKARIDQIDRFTIVLTRVDKNKWRLDGEAADPKGRTARTRYEAELEKDPLVEIWKRIEKNRDAATWLDLDLGIGLSGS